MGSFWSGWDAWYSASSFASRSICERTCESRNSSRRIISFKCYNVKPFQSYRGRSVPLERISFEWETYSIVTLK
jgi:hypothetical protein